MKIILDNSYAKLEDFDPRMLELINNELSVKQPGFYFSPAFKNGSWDGKVRFLDKRNNTFPSGLLDKVLAVIEDSVEVVDNRKVPKVKVSAEIDLYEPELPNGILTLRGYQYDAVVNSIEKKRGIVNVATNGGKTEIASGIIKQLLPTLAKDEKIIFVTHSKEIANQSAKRISKRLGIDVGIIGDGAWDEKQVTVVMVPTVSKHINQPKTDKIKYTKPMESIMLLKEFIGGALGKKKENRATMINALQVLEEQSEKDRDQLAIDMLTEILSSEKTDEGCFRAFNELTKKLKDFERTKLKKAFEKHEATIRLLESSKCFIVDEFHRSSGDSFYNTLMLCKNAVYRIGLTGTIDKKDEIKVMRLLSLTGEVVSKISNEYLINEGFSAKPIIILDKVMKPVLPKGTEYPEAYELGIVENSHRNVKIVDMVERKYNDNKGCLVIVSRKKHGENIAKLLEERGIEYEYVHGSRSTEDRQLALDNVKSGKLKVLVATNIMDEGVDISNIDAVFMAAGGKSFRQILQRVGRALRVKKDRENVCEIYDYLDYTQEHLIKHTKERYGYYKEEKFDIRRVEEYDGTM